MPRNQNSLTQQFASSKDLQVWYTYLLDILYHNLNWLYLFKAVFREISKTTCKVQYSFAYLHIRTPVATPPCIIVIIIYIYMHIAIFTAFRNPPVSYHNHGSISYYIYFPFFFAPKTSGDHSKFTLSTSSSYCLSFFLV